MSDSFNHLGLIWYQSEPQEVPYCPNQFLGLDFFAISYSKMALAKFNSRKKITQAKKKFMQAWNDMLPCAWRGVKTSGPNLGLAWTSRPVLKSGQPRNFKILTIHSSIQPQKNQITQVKKKIMQTRKDMLPFAFRDIRTCGSNSRLGHWATLWHFNRFIIHIQWFLNAKIY